MIEASQPGTPEEQLLRMIEGGQPAAPPPSPPPAKGRFDLSQLIARAHDAVSGLQGQWRRQFRHQDRGDAVLRNLRLASRVAWAGLAALGVYFLVAVVFTRPKQTPMILTTSLPQEGAVPALTPDDLNRPLSEYLASVLQRNPFTGGAGATSAAPVRTARDKLKELAGALVVVGIDRGVKPEALVEDTAAGRTHFIKVGDVINGMTVREISERGVILSYDGEELLLQ
jgi:hypothetical protein